LLGGISKECSDARELPRRRRGAQPACTAVGKEGAEVRRRYVRESRRIDDLAAIPPEEVDEAMRSRGISADRMGRAPSIMLKMI
jgi:hypothetical protein